MGLGDESKAGQDDLGVRMTDEDDGKQFVLRARACYRIEVWMMKRAPLSYLSQDRCGLQFAVKELARRMQLPDAKNMQALKRLVRFLKGSPRCLVVYGRQAEQQVVDVFSDSDWAGCVKTRRSTSSSYVMLGGRISLPRQPQLKMWWRQVLVTRSFTRKPRVLRELLVQWPRLL